MSGTRSAQARLCGVCLDELRIVRDDEALGIWRHSDGMLWSLTDRPHVARPLMPPGSGWAASQDSWEWATACRVIGVVAGVLYGTAIEPGERWQ